MIGSKPVVGFADRRIVGANHHPARAGWRINRDVTIRDPPFGASSSHAGLHCRGGVLQAPDWYKAIRAARFRLDRQYRPGCQFLRYARAEADEGYPHLSARGQLRRVQILLNHRNTESTVRYLGDEGG